MDTKLKFNLKHANTNPLLRTWQKNVQVILNERMLHAMILPSVIVVFIFSYIPMYGILIGFKQFDIIKGVFGSPWANQYGFEHFIDLFKDPIFVKIIRNTVVIAFLKIGFLSLPPVMLAIIINEVKGVHFKKVVQTLSYLPHFVSWVIVGGIFMTFFSPVADAPVNQLLTTLHLIKEPTDVINNTQLFWPLLLVSDFWKEVGWSSIIYLAVIASIDQELYEAIEIDGGKRWAKVRYITWPFIKGTFIILIILSCGNIMSGLGETFDQCYVLGTPMNRDVSLTLDIYVLKVGLENARYSFATAAGLFKAIINLSLLVMANKISKKVTDKGMF